MKRLTIEFRVFPTTISLAWQLKGLTSLMAQYFKRDIKVKFINIRYDLENGQTVREMYMIPHRQLRRLLQVTMSTVGVFGRHDCQISTISDHWRCANG